VKPISDTKVTLFYQKVQCGGSFDFGRRTKKLMISEDYLVRRFNQWSRWEE